MQFKNLIKTNKQLDSALKMIEEKPGPVLYTLMNPEMRSKLKQTCKDLNVPCIAVLGKVIKQLSNYLGIESSDTMPDPLNEQYFGKIDALNYALTHDDGQKYQSLQYADIVLIGVSRTSKTPTSIYLAFKGYKNSQCTLCPGITRIYL